MTQQAQADALRLAERIEDLALALPAYGFDEKPLIDSAAELRRLIARVKELEAQQAVEMPEPEHWLIDSRGEKTYMSASRFTASSFDTGHYTKLYTEQQVSAMVAAQAAPGWKLVPDADNMTDEQAEAIAELARVCGGGALDIYRAALEAAPTPQKANSAEFDGIKPTPPAQERKPLPDFGAVADFVADNCLWESATHLLKLKKGCAPMKEEPPMQIDRTSVKKWMQQFITSSPGEPRITDMCAYVAQRASEQEREACKAAIESCVNELGFGDGSPGRWMADRCLRAISERNKEKT